MDRDKHDDLMKREADKIERRFIGIMILSGRQKQIYRIILNNPGITNRQLCNMLSCQRPTLLDRLVPMIDFGLIISNTIDNRNTLVYKVDKRRKVIL